MAHFLTGLVHSPTYGAWRCRFNSVEKFVLSLVSDMTYCVHPFYFTDLLDGTVVLSCGELGGV